MGQIVLGAAMDDRVNPVGFGSQSRHFLTSENKYKGRCD
jgi:hypothetical protein